MPKYYAVRNGRKPGIYTTWNECKAQIDGYKGQDYKSFKTEQEAQQYLENKEKTISNIESVEGVYAYVDGSYNSGNSVYGSGIIIVNNSEKEEYKKAGDKQEYAQYWNIAGELEAAKFVMNYAVENEISEITIFHDLEGTSKWAKKEWKANNDYTKSYQVYFDEVSKEVKVNFVKVKGHAGVELNERADVLANEAIAEFLSKN